MSTTALTVNPTDEVGEIVDFNKQLKQRGFEVPSVAARLVSATGESIELPDELFQVLRFAAERLAANQGVTIAPVSKLMTTQEAADFLGMSRPSLVKIVDSGAIDHTKVGRHRKIRLADLLEYQSRMAKQRAEALDEMVQVARENGLYEKTAQSGVGIR